MFGPDLLVAPVLAEGVRARPVYLPAGTSWRCACTGEVSPGDTRVNADAPLERIPVYLRAESRPPAVEDQRQWRSSHAPMRLRRS